MWPDSDNYACIKFKIATLTSKKKLAYHYLVQQLRPYARHPTNFFKLHAPTSGLDRPFFVYLFPLSGSHCVTAFVPVNLQQLSGNTLKPFMFKRILWRPLATSASDSILDFGALQIHLLT